MTLFYSIFFIYKVHERKVSAEFNKLKEIKIYIMIILFYSIRY